MMNKILKTKTKSKPNSTDLAKNTQLSNGIDYSFRLIITIIERGSADEIVEILSKLGIKFHIVCQGDGTADSAILQLLNLDKSLKDVVICVVETAKCSEVLQEIRKGYHDGGISFSIKLNSIGGMRTLKLLKDNQKDSINNNDGDKKE